MTKWMSIGVGLALLLSGSVRSQTVLAIGDREKMQLQLQVVENAVRCLRAGHVGAFFSDSIRFDGAQTSRTEFETVISSVLARLPDRDVLVGSPQPDRLGPWWDFEIIDPQYEFADSTCIVSCTYRLSADGVRTKAAEMHFRKIGAQWGVYEVDGLIDILSQSVSYHDVCVPEEGRE